MTKTLLLVVLLVMTACVQKLELPAKVIQKTVIVSSWSWDDFQQHWVDKGTVFNAEDNIISEILWDYQKKAISLEIESVNNLSSFDKRNDSLLMKVFQFTDPRAFLIAIKSSSGIKRLLTVEQIDPACINSEDFIVLPGNKQQLTLDRVDGARYLGIVLGYSGFEQSQVSRLIPIITLKKDNKFTKKNVYSLKIDNENKPIVMINDRPALLKLKLSLGVNGINSLNIDAK